MSPVRQLQINHNKLKTMRTTFCWVFWGRNKTMTISNPWVQSPGVIHNISSVERPLWIFKPKQSIIFHNFQLTSQLRHRSTPVFEGPIQTLSFPVHSLERGQSSHDIHNIYEVLTSLGCSNKVVTCAICN